MDSGTQADEITSLEELAAAVRRHGLQATVHNPDGRLPFLEVSNPRATVLSERVYASAEAFWFSWAERIAGCDQASAAAGILASVLRTVDGEHP